MPMEPPPAPPGGAGSAASPTPPTPPAGQAAATPSADDRLQAPRLTPWLGVTGLLLLATLLAAAFVQVRQGALLNMAVLYQDDYVVLNLYQLETEYLRLREQMRHEPDADKAEALQLRYDIFVSRVGLLDGERAHRLLSATPVAAQAIQALNAFIRNADRWLGPGSSASLPPHATAALLAELAHLDGPLRRLMLEATHQVAAQITARQASVNQHNAIGLALTGFLSFMVLVFAVVALRQMRAQGERHRRLQALADELRDARMAADAANQAKSDFLADMSHELRTPLHGLVGMLSLLRGAPGQPQADAWLATAEDSARHLQELLDDILDLNKLESGALALLPAPVHLATLVREVQALLQPAAHAKGLGLLAELDPALPPQVWLDATRVRQVLFNLLTNAVKYSDSGAVVLRCARGQADDATPQLVFDVVDSGIGIDPDTLSRLFYRFSRAEDPLARQKAGAGLGLAISRKLARLMGGEVTARSAPGAGSMFRFTCPLLGADAPGTPPAAQPSGQVHALRVLVADDHPVNRMVMQAQLERLGHTCTLAEDGEQALALATAQAFDLVLMDVHMPVMNGYEAMAALRALPAPGGRCCIVALTADVFAETRQRCLNAGADDVLTKPLALPGLQALLVQRFGQEPLG